MKKLEKYGAIKGLHFGYSHRLDTPTGTAYVSLRDFGKGFKHLCCNFVGNEIKAKHKFGHWKVNAVINSEQDIETHLNYLKS